jgi:hypothetical protein
MAGIAAEVSLGLGPTVTLVLVSARMLAEQVDLVPYTQGIFESALSRAKAQV